MQAVQTVIPAQGSLEPETSTCQTSMVNMADQTSSTLSATEAVKLVVPLKVCASNDDIRLLLALFIYFINLFHTVGFCLISFRISAIYYRLE